MLHWMLIVCVSTTKQKKEKEKIKNKKIFNGRGDQRIIMTIKALNARSNQSACKQTDDAFHKGSSFLSCLFGITPSTPLFIVFHNLTSTFLFLYFLLQNFPLFFPFSKIWSLFFLLSYNIDTNSHNLQESP